LGNENILVIGALGQIGSELVIALRKRFGDTSVISADIIDKRNLKDYEGIYEHLNVLDRERLRIIADKYRINQVYHLAAVLSAKAEDNPIFAWRLNMQGQRNVLDLAREKNINKVFWPSSIAVFGPHTPHDNTPQYTVTDPSSAYGISKLAGERWASYYHHRYGIDIRSVRYPGLISHHTLPGGGTTDYAIDIFYQALAKRTYKCFLAEDATLPMMYMPDAIRATLELMDADAERITVRDSYNLAAVSFSPAELYVEIRKHIKDFTMTCQPDFRQAIAESWPNSIDDSEARSDWGWQHEYELGAIVSDMLLNLRE
jgi:nucleoside-diphosphate-sugar epimerase